MSMNLALMLIVTLLISDFQVLESKLTRRATAMISKMNFPGLLYHPVSFVVNLLNASDIA